MGTYKGRKPREKRSKTKFLKPKSPLSWNRTFRADIITGGSEVIMTKTPWVQVEPQWKEWESIPNYRELIKDGKQATGNFRRYGTEYYDYLGGYWWCTWMKSATAEAIQYVSGPFFTAPAPTSVPNALWTTASNASMKKLISQVQTARRKVQGGVILGELAETIRMIRTPAQSAGAMLHRYLGELRAAKFPSHNVC